MRFQRGGTTASFAGSHPMFMTAFDSDLNNSFADVLALGTNAQRCTRVQPPEPEPTPELRNLVFTIQRLPLLDDSKYFTRNRTNPGVCRDYTKKPSKGYRAAAAAPAGGGDAKKQEKDGGWRGRWGEKRGTKYGVNFDGRTSRRQQSLFWPTLPQSWTSEGPGAASVATGGGA